jgi:hypothetical protein
MERVRSRPGLGALRHPDQLVAPVGEFGLTLIAADLERVRSLAGAIQMSLTWQMPVLYALPSNGSASIPPFSLVRVVSEVDVVDDDALIELAARLEVVRDAVPARIMELTGTLMDTTSALSAADERRRQLKEVLGGHATVLATSPEARAVVGLYRRIASLELDRLDLPWTEVDSLRAAYEAMLAVRESELPVDRDAARLAAQWDRLLADEALLHRSESSHPLNVQVAVMQAKLSVAEQSLAAVRTDAARPRPSVDDLAEIERLHQVAQELEDRSGSRHDSAVIREQARTAERALLARFGFDTHADSVIAGALDSPTAALARCRAAEEKVASIQAVIAELRQHLVPSTERQSLLARADQLAAEITARFGEVDFDDDVARELRTIRQPPQAWHELVAALADRGQDGGHDPLAVARQMLEDASQVNRPVDAIDADIAELTGQLASFDEALLASTRPVGVVAAELVKVEHARDRLSAELAQLRLAITAELELDPSLRPLLEEMQSLDRELSDLAGQLRSETGRRSESSVRPALDEQLTVALGGLELDCDDPLIVAFDSALDQVRPSVPADAQACLTRLAELAQHRQVIVVTADPTLVDTAQRYGGVVSQFAPF